MTGRSLLTLSMLALFACSPVQVQVWSKHSKPFDLVWDVNDEDFNGLSLNPKWAYQLDHPDSLPDFKAKCGKAFYYNTGSTSSGNNSVHADVLARDYTSQHTDV